MDDYTVPVSERKIWWIASYPKSGNTWVRMFINAYVTGFPIDLNSAFQFAMGDLNPGYMQMVSIRPADNLTSTEQFAYRSAVLMNLISLSPAQHIVLKTHHAKVNADGFLMIPPILSKGAVYVIRDPRDVAISYADHMGISIDKVIEKMNIMQHVAEHRVTKLIHIVTTWSVHVESWTDKNNDIPVTVVRYEDMLSNPEEEFAKILKGLGFPIINEERFYFALEQTKFEELRKFEDKFGFRERGAGEKFFRVGKSGQWFDVLTNEQIAQIEKDHSKYMEKYGYTLSCVGV